MKEVKEKEVYFAAAQTLLTLYAGAATNGRSEGGRMMNLSDFVDEELQRVEEIKKNKTLQAMIRTRDVRIQRLQLELKWWRCLAGFLAVMTATLIVMLWI